MKKIGWADEMRNEEVQERVRKKRKILKTIRRRKRKWIGHWPRSAYWWMFLRE